MTEAGSGEADDEERGEMLDGWAFDGGTPGETALAGEVLDGILGREEIAGLLEGLITELVPTGWGSERERDADSRCEAGRDDVGEGVVGDDMEGAVDGSRRAGLKMGVAGVAVAGGVDAVCSRELGEPGGKSSGTEGCERGEDLERENPGLADGAEGG